MIGIFLRGLLMGAADAIPGVSGGTMAFITGIYERLITAVKAWSDIIVRRRIVWQALDFPFLLALGAGILLAAVGMSHLVGFLLEGFFVPTISFFIGLILASALFIYKQIEDRRAYLSGIGAFAVGIALAFVTPSRIAEPSLGYLFLSGVIGISAMFLPGISGAFILVIMGSYEAVLAAVRSFAYIPLGVFALGAALGAVFISRLIAFLFIKDRQRTLFALLGLVLGALSVPIRDILEAGPATPALAAVSALALFVGAGLVFGVERWAA